MHENDSSWNRHKSPRLQLYASLGIHKNLPMFLEKPPEEIIKTSRCFLESIGTLYSNDYNAAILLTLARRFINDESSFVVCMLYFICSYSKGSALTPSAASKSNAVFSVTGRLALRISLSAE